MSSKRPVLHLGTSESGSIQLHVDELAETRLLITATSGGGKTGTVFKLCEQAVTQMQVIVIDRESEYAPLRRKFPFVLVGPDGEVTPSVKTAALLAERLLELGVSAILDLYEMKRGEQHEFVKAFLTALVDAPKRLWPMNQNRLCMVVVDEAHLFVPEKGEPPSVAEESVEALATRGRKRGLISVFATQRLAAMSKTAAAMCLNTLVGLTSDIDEDRAAKQLRIGSREAKTAFVQTVARLRAGQFYAYGRAFDLRDATLFQVDRAETLPEKKERKLRSLPPAPDAIRDLLPKLADLPQEAERKAKTEAELREELRTAQKKIKELETAAPATPTIDEETIKMLKEKLDELAGQIETIETNVARYKAQLSKARQIAESLVSTLSEEEADRVATEFLRPLEREIRQAIPVPSQPRPVRTPTSRVASQPPADGEPISGPEQRILNAIAWMETIGVEEPEQPAVAFLAEYTYGSGGYNNPRGRLRQRGLIEYVAGDRLKLTTAGKGTAQYPNIEPTDEALHAAILGKLPGPEGKILTVLLKHYPKAMDATRLAEASGYAPGSGGFNNPRGRLKTLGLVEYPSPGMVVAKPLLFPEGR